MLDILFKRNEMIRAKYEYSATENKVVQKIFVDIQKNRKTFGTLTLEDMKDITDNKNLHTINGVKEMLSRMMKNEVKGNIKDKKIFVSAYIISSYKVDLKTGIFSVELSKTFQNLILNYDEENKETKKKFGYTSINVSEYLNLCGSNSQRIYELLRMWSGTKPNMVDLKVDDIREALCLQDKYEKFKDLRVKVIEASVTEINKRGLMKISDVEYVKKGRSVETINFYIKDLIPRTMDFYEKKVENIEIEEENYKVEELTIEQKIANISGIAISSIKKLIKTYGELEVLESSEILSAARQQEKIKAPLKYLTAILENRKNEIIEDHQVKQVKNTPVTNYNNPKVTRFNNYHQRDYDYEKLEEELLGWDD